MLPAIPTAASVCSACQSQQFRGRDGSAENPAGRRHMKTERVMFLRLHCHRDARGGFESGHNRGEQCIRSRCRASFRRERARPSTWSRPDEWIRRYACRPARCHAPPRRWPSRRGPEWCASECRSRWHIRSRPFAGPCAAQPATIPRASRESPPPDNPAGNSARDPATSAGRFSGSSAMQKFDQLARVFLHDVSEAPFFGARNRRRSTITRSLF